MTARNESVSDSVRPRARLCSGFMSGSFTAEAVGLELGVEWIGVVRAATFKIDWGCHTVLAWHVASGPGNDCISASD